jgi:hypothetical protein
MTTTPNIPKLPPKAPPKAAFPPVVLTQADYAELQSLMLEMRHKEALMLGRFFDRKLQRAAELVQPAEAD